MNILIIDDEPAVRKLLHAARVGGAGYRLINRLTVSRTTVKTSPAP